MKKDPVAFSSKEEGNIQSLAGITKIVYILQMLSFVFGISLIIAIVLNYIKKEDVADTWLASHFRWQIRTFWFSMLWSAVGAVTSLFLVGYLVLFANLIWFIYRVVKGWLKFSEGKEMYS